MGKFQQGRHAPAFILISLTDGPSYGLELMQKINDLIPGNRLDMAILYRTLAKLEEQGLVTVTLDDSRSGPVRKYYTITEAGYETLDEFEEDIRFRVRNLNIFLNKYEEMKRDRGGAD